MLAWLAMFFNLAAEKTFRPLLCRAVPGTCFFSGHCSVGLCPVPGTALLRGGPPRPGPGHCSLRGGSPHGGPDRHFRLQDYSVQAPFERKQDEVHRSFLVTTLDWFSAHTKRNSKRVVKTSLRGCVKDNAARQESVSILSVTKKGATDSNMVSTLHRRRMMHDMSASL